jgi:hypothetical protein
MKYVDIDTAVDVFEQFDAERNLSGEFRRVLEGHEIEIGDCQTCDNQELDVNENPCIRCKNGLGDGYHWTPKKGSSNG